MTGEAQPRSARRGLALHPYLFCVWPLLELYAQNLAEVELASLVTWAAGTLAAVALTHALLRLVYRDWRKSAVITTWLVLGFFLYPTATSAAGAGAGPWLAAAGAIVTVALALVVYRSRASFRLLSDALSVMSAVALAQALLTLPGSLSEVRQAETDLWTDIHGVETPAYRPDIYYVILDGYGSEQVLREYYDLDIGPFIEELEGLGFYVARSSRSNYPRTLLSLPSSLNMAPLEKVDPEFWGRPRGKKAIRRWLTRRVGDSAVPIELRRRGYDFHLITSPWGASGRSPWATRVHPCRGISEFGAQVLKNSLAGEWGVARALFIRSPRRQRVLCQFETLEKIAALRGPKFVFTHILAPHGPWIFGPEGGIVEPGAHRGRAGRLRGYADQVRFVNRRLVATLRTLLEAGGRDTVVVIQGDHGPAYAAKRLRGALKKRMKRSSYATVERMLSPKGEFAPFVFERMGILNAYHLPRQGASRLYPEITPVNSFRLVFDLYFGTSLGLERDASYYPLSRKGPGFWGFDVTETARLDRPPPLPPPESR